MTLKEGIYEIRYVPEHIKLPFMGGAYATADNINAPVRAEGMNPQAVTGTQHVRIIVLKKPFLESQSDGDHSGMFPP